MKKPLFGEKHYYMYLFETMFDSTVAALVSGTFFAKLTTSLGISDATTAILAQVGNLTIVLYLLSAFISRSRRIKPIVFSMQLAYQFLISLIYILPLFAFKVGTTEFLFFVLILTAKAISFCYGGAKSGWYVANIPEEKRASFFGISQGIVYGVIFVVDLLVGKMIDRMEENGNLVGAFTAIFLILLALTALNVTTILLTRTPSEDFHGSSTERVTTIFKDLWKHDGFRTLTLQRLIFSLASLATIGYLSTYLILDIGISMSDAALFAALHSAVYAIFLALWGKIGERFSLLKIYGIGMILVALSSVTVIFMSPEHYLVPYLIHIVLINCGNAAYGVGYMLTYRILPERYYAAASAFATIPISLLNFFGTLALAPLFNYLKYTLDSTLFGRTFYAQQTFAVIATVLHVLSITYLLLVVYKKLQAAMDAGDNGILKEKREQDESSTPIDAAE